MRKKQIQMENEVLSKIEDLLSGEEITPEEAKILFDFKKEIENKFYFPKAIYDLERKLRVLNNSQKLSPKLQVFYLKIVEINQRKDWMVGLIV